MDELAPGTTLGQYRIEDIVGAGGMATVYRAHHVALDRTVAIKVLPARFLSAPSFVDRFRQEARMVARLRHPYIMEVYDFGEGPGGLLYIVTEFMEGGTLAARLGSPMRPELAARILGQVASGLDYAHVRGIVHRDLKPGNILLTADGDAVVADFGLAKILEGTGGLTQAGTVLGTPEYMSPEQAMGKPLDRRTDVYSMGVMLFAMLTGAVPYHRDSPLATMVAHIHEPVPAARDRNPNLLAAVEQVLSRALAKTPDERYRTAGELAAAFGAATGIATLPDSGFFAATPLPSSGGGVPAAALASAPPSPPSGFVDLPFAAPVPGPATPRRDQALPPSAPPQAVPTGIIERSPGGTARRRNAGTGIRTARSRNPAVAIAAAAIVVLIGGIGLLVARQAGSSQDAPASLPAGVPPRQSAPTAAVPAGIIIAPPSVAPEVPAAYSALAPEPEPGAAPEPEAENASGSGGQAVDGAGGGSGVQAADLGGPPPPVEQPVAEPQAPPVQAPAVRPPNVQAPRPTATPRPASRPAPAVAEPAQPAAAQPAAPANTGPAAVPMGGPSGQSPGSGAVQVAPMGAPGGQQAPPVTAPQVEQPRRPASGATIAPMGAP
jgi:serine/threonine protein kinase